MYQGTTLYKGTCPINQFEEALRGALLRGARIFTNYPSTKGPARAQVMAAVEKRVTDFKSFPVGTWADSFKASLRSVFSDYFILPLGGVDKPLEPGVTRVTCDACGVSSRVICYNILF